MIGLRIISLATALILGIVAAAVIATPLPLAALLPLSLAGLAASAWFWRRERRWIETPAALVVLGVALVAAPAGYWRAMQRLGPPPPGTLARALAELPDRARLDLRGMIATEPEIRASGRGEFELAADAWRRGPAEEWHAVKPGRILMRVFPSRGKGSPPPLFNRLMDPRAYGYRLQLRATVERPETAQNPGDFDPAAFLLQQDVLAQARCSIADVELLEESRGWFLVELAMETKRSFLSTYRATIREPASRLVAGTTLGLRRALERVSFRGMDITQGFRHCGVGHVLAVSGLHVSIIAVLLYGLFRLARLTPRQFTPPLVFFLVVFAVLTGARPSSLRAVIMNAFALAAFSYFRLNLRHAALTGMALSSFLILLVRPMVLFSPGFLLSYGAVLSLVLVAPPLNRWILRLRGAALLLVVAEFFALVVLYATFPAVFVRGTTWLGVLGATWLLIALGGRLNEAAPRLWRISLHPWPNALRMFLCAQLAIQVGMMIPLSAWFFGQFPVAGMFVNLIAIPAIGVQIQVGMLTGLLGLIPVLGTYLAMPFGAAATVASDFFYWLVYAGQKLFPLPAIPRPSLLWMMLYYCALGLLLPSDAWTVAAQTRLYAWWARCRRPRAWTAAAYLLPLALAACPLLQLLPRPERIASVVCFAGDRYPFLAFLSRRHTAVLVNAADRFRGGSALFHGLRSHGAVQVRLALLCGPQPEAGNEGLAALAARMPVRECRLPFATASPDAYLQSLGDEYLREAADRGEAWAERYREAYADLRAALAAAGTAVAPLRPGPQIAWADARIGVLPGPDSPPARYAASAHTAVLRAETRGFRWLVITDTTSAALSRALAGGDRPCDVLVLPVLERASWDRLMDQAVRAVRPAAVILCGRLPEGFSLRAWSRAHGLTRVLATEEDGAVIASFAPGNALELRGHASGVAFMLPARRRP